MAFSSSSGAATPLVSKRPTPLFLTVLAWGGCLLVFVLTLGTLSVATTCSVPLEEGGLSSAPVTRLGVAARLSSLLRRLTGGEAGPQGALGGGGGSSGGFERSLSGAELLPLKARAQRLLALISGEDSEGSRALGPAVHIARKMVDSIMHATKHDDIAASALEAATKGAIPITSPVWQEDWAYTNQTCYLSPDEAEICTYSGPLCFDGEGPVVVTVEPLLQRFDDLVHTCMDARFKEPTSVAATGCKPEVMPHGGAVESVHSEAAAKEGGALPPGIDLHQDTTYPLHTRRWGPANRGKRMLFREMHPAQVWGDQAEVVAGVVGSAGGGQPGAAAGMPALLSLGAKRKAITLGLEGLSEGARGHLAPLAGANVATQLLEVGPLPHPSVPGLTLAARTRVGDVDIDWVAPGLWLVGLDADEETSPLRFMRRVLSLFDAHRANATPGFLDHPRDGYMHFLDSWQVASAPSVYTETSSKNRVEYKVGNQWAMPPMGTVAFSGAGGAVPRGSLGDFFSALFALAAPKAAAYLGELQAALGPKRLLCSVAGGIPGAKHRLFSGRADAAMFKTYVYQSLGLNVLGLKPHPRYAPRKILVLNSAHTHDSAVDSASAYANQRIWNAEEVLEAVKATGVPYQVVDSMEGMSFKDTVKLFATTGILIAPHGDAMAMSVFMPAHSVTVELFPYGIKRNTFRQLANFLDLHYLPIYSSLRVPVEKVARGDESARVYSRDFWEQCESKNLTGYDSATLPFCTQALAAHPLVVNIPELKVLLRDAVDCASSFSLKNPEWAALAETEGLPVRPPPVKPPGQADKYGEWQRTPCSMHLLGALLAAHTPSDSTTSHTAPLCPPTPPSPQASMAEACAPLLLPPVLQATSCSPHKQTNKTNKPPFFFFTFLLVLPVALPLCASVTCPC